MLTLGNKRPCHTAQPSWVTGRRAPAVTPGVSHPVAASLFCFCVRPKVALGSACSQSHISLSVDQQRLRLVSQSQELKPTKGFGDWVLPATHPWLCTGV